MADHRFQDIWKKQCEAAREVREQHGVVSALDYLIGEKLMIYAETAVTHSEFARELPRFVAEVRRIFEPTEISLYVDHLDRMAAQDEEELSAMPADDDLMIETPEQRAAARQRLARLKELLILNVLGTA